MTQARRRAIVAWVLYDFANSSFTTLVVTFVYARYFTEAIASSPVEGTSLWGYAMTVTAIIVVLSSPILGALADQGGYRKRFLLTATLICAAATAALYGVLPGQVAAALVIVVIANVAFELAGVFYNAYLPELTTSDRIGRLSGWGWGVGYIGGLLALGVALMALAMQATPWFGFSVENGENIRATNLLVAVWLLVFSLPVVLWLHDRKPSGRPQGHVVRRSFGQLLQTFREIRKHRETVKFLLARLFYNEGLVTIFAFGAIYASGTFGFSITEVLVFGIVINLAAGIGEKPLTRHAVEDLRVVGAPGDRAQEPFPPRFRLVHVATGHQRVEGEGRVTEPAIAVVPVPHAAEPLGQGGRGRGHQPAGRRVRERLQRDEGAHHRLLPGAVVRARRRPRAPPLLGLLDRGDRIPRRRLGLVRRVPGEREGHAVPGAHGEVGDGPERLPPERDRRPQAEGVVAPDRADPVLLPAHPGHPGSVVGPEDELRPHGHGAPPALDEPHHRGGRPADRHAVDQRDGALVGLELGLEDQRALAVAPADGAHGARRRDQPARRRAGGAPAGRARGRRRAQQPDVGAAAGLDQQPGTGRYRRGARALAADLRARQGRAGRGRQLAR